MTGCCKRLLRRFTPRNDGKKETRNDGKRKETAKKKRKSLFVTEVICCFEKYLSFSKVLIHNTKTKSLNYLTKGSIISRSKAIKTSALHQLK
jgi:hypothetical protein